MDDLPWSSIDLGDIDLFGGASAAEKDVMHSVLDMDPSVMHRLFMNEPSTSAAVTDTCKTQKTPPGYVYQLVIHHGRNRIMRSWTVTTSRTDLGLTFPQRNNSFVHPCSAKQRFLRSLQVADLSAKSLSSTP